MKKMSGCMGSAKGGKAHQGMTKKMEGKASLERVGGNFASKPNKKPKKSYMLPN